MAPQTAKSLMKDFRASFRRKKVVVEPRSTGNALKEANEEELGKIAEAKQSIEDEIISTYSDAMLLGFLRARSLNMIEAEKLIKLDYNLRKLLRIEQYKVPEEFYQYSISSIIGYDKDGCLVRMVNVGGIDVKGLLSTISTIEVFKILLRMIQDDTIKQDEYNKKIGKKTSQFVYLLNMENLTMSQVTYKPGFDSAMQALKLLQDHYHDALKLVIFVNAPPFFSSVYKLFKPVIQDSLQEKIRIFDHETGKEELLKLIDADVLPEYFGGNRLSISQNPNSKIHFGFTVPEDNYVNNFLDPDDPEVTVATVPAGSFLNFRFPIREIGTVTRWHIQAKDNDIGVGVYLEPFQTGSETPRTQNRKKKEEDMSKYEQLSPIIRCQCHICPEEGSCFSWTTGNLIVHFDNSYSWMNSKDVYFKITTIPPSQTEKNSINSEGEVTRKLNKIIIKD